MENEVWKNNIPCAFSQHICFHQILYKRCYFKAHSERNIRQMQLRYDNIKYEQKRELEKIQPQYQEPCKSGFNCYYLLAGDCEKLHSTFDLKWAFNVLKRIYQIKCPISGCQVEKCLYYHNDKIDQYSQLCQQKLKKLYKQAKLRQKALKDAGLLKIKEKKRIKK